MKLLALTTPADVSYYPMLRGLTTAAVHPTNRPITNLEVLRQVFIQHQCDAIVCCCEDSLIPLLESQSDYVKSGKPTLDQYAGSVLDLWVGTRRVEVLILNPIAHLRTVAYAKFLFKRYLTKLTNPEKWLPEVPFRWKLIELVYQVDELMVRWSDAEFLSVDIETQVGCPERSINIVGFTALWLKGGLRTESVIIPFEEEWQIAQVYRLLNTSTPKLYQNGLYDNHYHLRWGTPPRNWRYDTHILFHAWLAELPKRLDFIASFSVRKIRYWKQESGGNLQDYYRYCARDTWATALSWIALIRECPEWAFTNYLINFPKVFPALTMSVQGLPSDLERLDHVRDSKLVDAELDLVQLRSWLGDPNFNPNSPLQVKNLFSILGCSHLPDTAASSMERAKAAHPINDMILSTLIRYKKARKLISTYLVPEKFWHSRVYYQVVVAATDTNRRASKESSFWCGLQLQNIPRGDTVKQLIHADEGWDLNEWDKSNAESRCTAHLANEPAMIAATEGEDDYHSRNASRFFAIPYEEIFDNATRKQLNKALRDLSKRVNHGSNYQMGAHVMLLTMGPRYVAQARKLLGLHSLTLLQTCEFLLSGFERTYPRIRGDWVSELVHQIETTGTLVSLLGWTRRFFGDMSTKPARNAAVAHGPQNLSVAVLDEEIFQIWYASIYGYYFKIHDFKQAYAWSTKDRSRYLTSTPLPIQNRIRIAMQIHDSLLFQSRTGDKEALELVNTVMNNTLTVNNRPLHIPHDRSNSAKYWSEIK